jgi:hypothetical protein
MSSLSQWEFTYFDAPMKVKVGGLEMMFVMLLLLLLVKSAIKSKQFQVISLEVPVLIIVCGVLVPSAPHANLI